VNGLDICNHWGLEFGSRRFPPKLELFDVCHLALRVIASPVAEDADRPQTVRQKPATPALRLGGKVSFHPMPLFHFFRPHAARMML
jgi:hypothetical protein